MAESSKTILRHILEQSSSTIFSSSADKDNFQKLKDDYDSCMNEQELQNIGLKPLQGIVNQIKMSFAAATDRTKLSDSPATDTSAQKGVTMEETSQLTDTILLMMEHDIRPFMTFDVGVRIASIPSHTTLLSISYLVKKLLMKLWHRLMTETLTVKS